MVEFTAIISNQNGGVKCRREMVGPRRRSSPYADLCHAHAAKMHDVFKIRAALH